MRMSLRPDMSISATHTHVWLLEKTLFKNYLSALIGKIQDLSMKPSVVHLRSTNITMDGTKVPVWRAGHMLFQVGDLRGLE